MKREQRQFLQRRSVAAQFLSAAAVLLAALPPPAVAQDIRGLEVCTAEKQMERRTGCLQANIDFLQQALLKLARETEDKIAAANRELAAARADLTAARAEIAALKSTVEKLSGEFAQMRAKAAPNAKK